MAAKNVTTAQVRLDSDQAASNRSERRMTYYNAGSTDAWLIKSGEAAGTGTKLAPGGTATESLRVGETRWAITSSGSTQVNVDQMGG